MEFNELIADFAKRHKVENLVAVDGAAALDIDGIIVTIVAKGDLLNFSAEIGEPPADGAALFANLLLEANTSSPCRLPSGGKGRRRKRRRGKPVPWFLWPHACVTFCIP